MSLFASWGSMFYQKPLAIDSFMLGPKVQERGWPLVFLRCTTETIGCQTSYWPLVQNTIVWFIMLLIGWVVILALSWLFFFLIGSRPD